MEGGAFLVDLSGRAKLRFEGPQALWFLDQLVTNKVDELAPGSGAEALLLTPGGRVTSQVRILHLTSVAGAESQDVLVDAPEGHAQQLLDFFQMRVFATRVTVSDVSEKFGIVRALGAEAERVVAEAAGPDMPGAEEHRNVSISPGEAIDGLVVRVDAPSEGFDVWSGGASRADVFARLQKAGARFLPAAEYESLRVAAGVPVYGVDFDESYLPQEAAFEKAVHFAKGCYLGQEAVAMAQRGRVKRRLRHLRFEAEGTTGKVIHGGKDAGKVTSAGVQDGRWSGIATVKTEVPLGGRVEVAGDAGRRGFASVQELPGTTYGPQVPSARDLREKLQGR